MEIAGGIVTAMEVIPNPIGKKSKVSGIILMRQDI